MTLLSVRRKNILVLKVSACGGAVCDNRCFCVLLNVCAHVPPSEAAGTSALVIFPVVLVEAKPLFVSAAVSQVLPQQLARVDLSASTSS